MNKPTIKIRLLPKSNGRPYPFDLERTARWALAQAARRWPHGVSRLDVLERAAALALERGMGVVFVNGVGEYGPAEVLGMLERGEDPRPVHNEVE
jgi:hypothetical protein